MNTFQEIISYLIQIRQYHDPEEIKRFIESNGQWLGQAAILDPTPAIKTTRSIVQSIDFIPGFWSLSRPGIDFHPFTEMEHTPQLVFWSHLCVKMDIRPYLQSNHWIRIMQYLGLNGVGEYRQTGYKDDTHYIRARVVMTAGDFPNLTLMEKLNGTIDEDLGP